MANEITTTEGAVFIPERWRPGFLKALTYKGKIRNRILSADGDVKGMGDILHIRIAPTGVANNVTAATGAITNQALTPTEAQLTVDKWKDYSFDIVDNVKEQADQYLEAALKESAPAAFAKAIDSDIFDLVASGLTTQTAIDATSGLSADHLTDAFYQLAVDEVDVDDPNNLSWFFHWKQYPVLKKIAGLSEAQITGEGQGGILKFKVPDILGVPVYFSSEVQLSTNHYNILVHREALACGVQRNFNMEQLARVRKSTPYSADMMYGVKVVRATHGIALTTAA
jgi:HK97 family phage major capsid protein